MVVQDQIGPETELSEVEDLNGGVVYPGRFERLSEEQLKRPTLPVPLSRQQAAERDEKQDDDTEDDEDDEDDDECGWCHKGVCLSPLPLDRCWERRSIYVSVAVEGMETIS